jgi:hypothetical protein
MRPAHLVPTGFWARLCRAFRRPSLFAIAGRAIGTIGILNVYG